jgi:hypothetical protein
MMELGKKERSQSSKIRQIVWLETDGAASSKVKQSGSWRSWNQEKTGAEKSSKIVHNCNS